jgi:23S rRNA (cytidine1920-2'-O)/16S rRNA (cytidine1409-2'-O)-methyltransferase
VKKRRLDVMMAEQGLAESREKARIAILAGDVRVNGEAVTKPALSVDEAAQVELAKPPRYVSRGGDKLEHALDALGVDVQGRVVLDVGASTGGFTDCLLQRGAARIYAVDVGYGQLHYRLRQDPRVIPMEKTHIKTVVDLPERASLATIDVSFIGLENVLPSVTRLLEPGARVLALIKPQFQAERGDVNKGGVVRDPLLHASVIGKVIHWASQHGLRYGGLATSPLRGPAGNKEFFVVWDLDPLA